jgi:hypothetical protein
MNVALAGDSQAPTAIDPAPAGQVEQAPPPADPLSVALAEADDHPQVVQCVRDALRLLADKLQALTPAA